jgi:hypothetical protein
MLGGPSLIWKLAVDDNGDKGGALRGGDADSGTLEVGLPLFEIVFLRPTGTACPSLLPDCRVNVVDPEPPDDILDDDVDTDKCRTLGTAFKSHLNRGGFLAGGLFLGSISFDLSYK